MIFNPDLIRGFSYFSLDIGTYEWLNEDMEKRRVSVLVPYKTYDGSVYLFMQKRAKDRKRGGDMFGFFGGGIEESETPEEALLRESREELDLIPSGFSLFKKYDLPGTAYFSDAELYLFVLPVGDDFENRIDIKSEGQYARWFSREDYLKNKELIAGNLFIMDELYDELEK